jgi:hypothetical protein
MQLSEATYAGPAISKTDRISADPIVAVFIQQYPNAGYDEIAKLVFTEVVNDHDTLRVIVKEWTHNVYNNIKAYAKRGDHKHKRMKEKQQEQTSRAEDVKAKAKEHVRKVREIIVMDILLPIGKTVREATGAECKAAGGLFLRIAAKVKPNQIVGKVLSDEQAQALWEKAKRRSNTPR